MQKRLLLVLALMLNLCNLHAREKAHPRQSTPIKIGYVNVEYVLGLLPETKVKDSEFVSFRKQLIKQIQDKEEEYQQKVQTLKKGGDSMNQSVRSQKELELQQLQEGIRRLQLEWQGKLARKQISLLGPIYDKIKDVVVQVAKEHGYTHVLNADVENMNVLLYVDEEYNISDRVLKKLGVDPNKAKAKN